MLNKCSIYRVFFLSCLACCFHISGDMFPHPNNGDAWKIFKLFGIYLSVY
jgi:hypothetical protein